MKIKIFDGMYAELAERLIEEIDGESYVSTSIRVERKHFAVELSVSLLLHYDTERVELDRSCYGSRRYLNDITTIWWECVTYWFEEDYERRVENDCDFEKVKLNMLLR